MARFVNVRIPHWIWPLTATLSFGFTLSDCAVTNCNAVLLLLHMPTHAIHWCFKRINQNAAAIVLCRDCKLWICIHTYMHTFCCRKWYQQSAHVAHQTWCLEDLVREECHHLSLLALWKKCCFYKMLLLLKVVLFTLTMAHASSHPPSSSQWNPRLLSWLSPLRFAFRHQGFFSAHVCPTSEHLFSLTGLLNHQLFLTGAGR